MEKRAWRTWLADYLTFSRRERIAILLLVGMVLVIWIVPRFWLPSPQPVLITDSVIRAIRSVPVVPVRPLRPFDPNTLDEKGWVSLGVALPVAQRIIRYRERGGQFKQPGEIGKIYGMDPDLVTKLLPFVSIAAYGQRHRRRQGAWQYDLRRDTMHYAAGTYRRQFNAGIKSNYPDRGATVVSLDINTADSLAWMTLPGIGPVLAGRIVRYRDRLGGFYAREQLREIYGTDTSLWHRLSGRIRIGEPVTVRQLSLNDASRDDLSSHPYIRWRLATAILRYRETHGPFRDIRELRQIHVLSDSLYQKLLPYWKIH
ncbi:ComEA family DNA-binding protein [Flavihumibacter petaseus]|uniref:DNA-binding protein n=1 Tax=Flavihumibacter petaseus NBRC 106054 TaxID=1220578 RepID=A0A0E9N4Y4_9BACT|nr:helix-hairpin-helix domain-containing protein [Flavihumibacter petaseus]GAO45027.1 hypothetical protein FPE01S_04_02700 [Flavihumibacter petaseus NBRC 106054]